MPFLFPVIIKFRIIQMPIVKHINNKKSIPHLPFEAASFTVENAIQDRFICLKCTGGPIRKIRYM